jgi:uncharacterized protein (DUF302 family)
MKLLTTSIITSLICLSAYSKALQGDIKYTPTDNKTLAVYYTYDKKFDKDFFEFTSELESIGYYINDPHHNVNRVYEKEFGSTVLETLNFNSIVIDEAIRPMLNIDPRIAAFSPFNLLMYRKKSDHKTVIAHLTPEAMLDILEITDKNVRSKFIAAYKPLDPMIEKKFAAKKSLLPLSGYAKDTMMNFEIPFEEPEDIDDYLDEFQEKFEATFQMKGYIIAGYYNMKESPNSEDEEVLASYSSFWSYDLCHIPFSYEVFDGKNALPMAGIFAPCSMYVYVKEGENKFVIGMPTLRAWAGAMDITDKHKLEKIDNLDREITEIILGLGGKEVPNGNPLLRK